MQDPARREMYVLFSEAFASLERLVSKFVDEGDNKFQAQMKLIEAATLVGAAIRDMNYDNQPQPQ